MSASIATTIRSERRRFETKVRLLEAIEHLCAGEGPRACDRFRSHSAQAGRVVEILRGGWRKLPRRAAPLVSGERLRDRRRARSAGKRAVTAMVGAGGFAGFLATAGWQAAADEGRAAGADQPRSHAGAGRRDGCGPCSPAGRASCCTKPLVTGSKVTSNRKKTSAFAGLNGPARRLEGLLPVGRRWHSPRSGGGSLSIDDEGTPASRTVLIEDGILVGYMQDPPQTHD